MTDKWTYTSRQSTKQGKSLLTYQLSSLFMITWSQPYIKLTEWEKVSFVVLAGYWKHFLKCVHFTIFRQCCNGQGLLQQECVQLKCINITPGAQFWMDLCPLQGWLNIKIHKDSLNIKKKKNNLYHGLLGNKWEDIASMWEGKDCAAQKKWKKNDHVIPEQLNASVIKFYYCFYYVSVTVLSNFEFMWSADA